MNVERHCLFNGLFLIVLCMAILQVSLLAQSPSLPYDYQTKLKGGYQIVYKEDAEFQYIYLKKGRKTISELGSASLGLPHKNLGYVGVDFKDYFVLVRSYGSGNPHEIELIRKIIGKNVLQTLIGLPRERNRTSFYTVRMLRRPKKM